jgi:hypothetical protein
MLSAQGGWHFLFCSDRNVIPGSAKIKNARSDSDNILAEASPHWDQRS